MSQPTLRLYDADSRRLYLNQEERRQFHDAASHQPKDIKAFALTLLFTGCRVSEACSLRSDALQPGARSLSIVSLKKRRRHAVRELPIPHELADALLAIAPTQDGYFWPVADGPLPRITGYRWIKAIMAEANIGGAQACPKGLRHGYGVNATMAGIQIHMLQRWMGHASIETTAIYATVIGPDEHRLAARMWTENHEGLHGS
ncbi:site-specific integrase [Ruegeria sp. HKCCD8929]|uniref:tyrosine-type recombinase/integrase n=1 Tax=Ruegeria sp. HKCCD8929 TaxID=2683006 RepID=UPI0014878284|nr:site-specific integrase [Ruegeria sp. HKCCD8929]